MSQLQQLENNLDDLFVKKVPPLPATGKKALVEYLPWINLVLGLFELIGVYGLWHWAHLANGLVNYANSLNATYGNSAIVSSHMSLGLWLGLILLGVQAIMYIAAFTPTRARQKSGWNLLFYALLLNVVYGVVILFTSYGSLGNLIGAIIGSGIGLYLLFQIRGSYTKAPTPKKLV